MLSTTWSPSSELPDTTAYPTESGGPVDTTLIELESRLGRAFDDPSLLEEAVSHRSWCAEVSGNPSNERLEFLGDAVLGLIVADHCYRSYPTWTEGDYSQVRAAVVNSTVLGSGMRMTLSMSSTPFWRVSANPI